LPPIYQRLRGRHARCTSNTLLKIINKQRHTEQPNKEQGADFRFTERDFCAAQYLNTIANNKTQQCRAFNRTTITSEISIVLRAAISSRSLSLSLFFPARA